MKKVSKITLRLQNGFNILFVPIESEVVTIGFFAKAGSIYDLENPGSGIAHLLEHILSSGTNSLSNSEFEELVEELGGNINAYTTEEISAYYATVRREKVLEAFFLLKDMVIEREIEERDFRREKSIVEEELALIDEEIEDKILDDFRRNIYIEHPLRYPVAGLPELFKNITLDAVKRFYKRHYVTENMVLVIVGSPDESEIEKIFDSLSKVRGHPAPPLPLLGEPAEPSPPRIENENTKLDHGIVGAKVTETKNRYELEIAIQAVASGETSKLLEKMKDDDLVNYMEPFSFFPENGPGFVAIYFVSPKGRGEEAAKKILDYLRKTTLSDEEIIKAKRTLKRELLEDFLTSEGVFDLMGGDFIRTGNPLHTIEGVEKVKPEEALEHFKKLIERERRWTYLIYTPQKRKSFYFDLNPTPEPKTITLLSLYGYQFEKRPGLRYLTLRTIMESMKRTGFLSFIEDIGGTLDWEVERDLSVMRIIYPGDTTALEKEKFLKEVFAPFLDNTIFKRAKDDVLDEIEEEEEDWLNEALKYMKKHLYSGHPYERQPYGSREDIENLMIEDIEASLLELRDSPHILIVGGELETYNERGNVKFTGVPPMEKGGEFLYRWGRKESVVIFATRGPSLNDSDRFTVEALLYFIGGFSSSGGLLSRRLRSKGLVYYTSAYYSPYLASGDIVLLAATRNSETDEIEGEIEAIIDEIKTRELNKRELRMARENALLAEKLRRSNPIAEREYRARKILLGDRGTPDFESIEAGDLLRVAQKYFRKWIKVRILAHSRSDLK